MTHTLLLSLKGPLQSWGVDSAFPVRRTGGTPSKSGVIGLVASALGRERGESLEDLTALEFAVRVEHPGTLIEDFQTAKMVPSGKAMPLSRRQYLCDAHFTAALGGPREKLEEIAAALKSPRWPLFLGRRSCPPMGPVAGTITEGRPREVLTSYPPQVSETLGRRRRESTVVLDIYADAQPGAVRYSVARDIPVDFSLERRIHTERRFERLRSDPLPNPYAREDSQSRVLETEELDPLELLDAGGSSAETDEDDA